MVVSYSIRYNLNEDAHLNYSIKNSIYIRSKYIVRRLLLPSSRKVNIERVRKVSR